MQQLRRSLKRLSACVGVAYLLVFLLSLAVLVKQERFLRAGNVGEGNGAVQVVLKNNDGDFDASQSNDYEEEGGLDQSPEVLRSSFPAVYNVSDGTHNYRSIRRGERNDSVDEAFIKAREKVYEERRARVSKVCHDLAGTVSYGSVAAAPLTRLRWLPSHNLVMCFNAKVGTTTWTKYLLEAGFPGLLEKATNWHYAAYTHLKPPHPRTSKDTLALMEEFGPVMLVRHPFVRLVSAYFDKVATGYLRRICSLVIKKYRAHNSGLPAGKPSFEEFLRFLVEVTPAEDDIWAKRRTMTDRHWFPYYANCAPCDIHYDVIGTMETVKDDTRYILHKYQLGDASDDWWMNRHTSSSSLHTAIQLFQRVPRELTLALYERYRVDFLMFGYDLAPYLSTTPPTAPTAPRDPSYSTHDPS
nr:carbohydrate sulfotransferase 11-like isoform X2 [Procambarus clarkii]